MSRIAGRLCEWAACWCRCLQGGELVVREMAACGFSFEDCRGANDSLGAFSELLLAERCQTLCSSGVVRRCLCVGDRFDSGQELAHDHRPRHRRVGVR